MSQYISLLYLLSAITTHSLFSCESADTKTNHLDKGKCSSDYFSLILKIKDLCAKNISVKNLKACKINNATDILTDGLLAKNIAAKFIAVDRLGVNNDTHVNNLSVGQNLCIGGLFQANETYQEYRATAELYADTTYTLGELLPFNTTEDDPYNSISFQSFAYTVPTSGYYMINIEVDSKDLIISVPNNVCFLAGATAHIDLIINGTVAQSSPYAYMTFNNGLRSVMNSLLRVNADDVIQAAYRITTMNPSVGPVELIGKVTLEGGPSHSHFMIHYLSSTHVTPSATPCIPSTFDTTI